jgi:hypothetical protein
VIDPQESPLTDVERRHVESMMKQPGWKVINRIMEDYIGAMTDSATATSLQNPLGNRDAIAHRWAYITMAQQFRAQVLRGIAFELGLLRKDAEQLPEEEIKRRRAWNTLGMIGPVPDDFKYKRENPHQ